jgi:hypothetical protein
MKPILLWRSFRTAPGVPQLQGECSDFIMPKWGDAMSAGNRLRMPVGLVRVFQRLPGSLLAGRVILFSVLLGDPMGMRGGIV